MLTVSFAKMICPSLVTQSERELCMWCMDGVTIRSIFHVTELNKPVFDSEDRCSSLGLSLALPLHFPQLKFLKTFQPILEEI